MVKVDRPTLVIVSGMPGAGKSTIARRLGEVAHMPVLDRDDLKDTLFDALGWEDRAWSQRLGGASWALMFRLMEQLLLGGASFVADTNFSPSNVSALQTIRECVHSLWIEVHCFADAETCAARMALRRTEGGRHPGHNPDANDAEDYLPVLRSRTWGPTGLADTTFEIDTASDPCPDLGPVLRALSR